jgi:hypothetical protein
MISPQATYLGFPNHPQQQREKYFFHKKEAEDQVLLFDISHLF